MQWLNEMGRARVTCALMLALFGLAACGTPPPETEPLGDEPGAATGGEGGAPGLVGSSSSSGAGGLGDGGAPSAGVGGSAPAAALTDVGSLVVLGDSIGDGGGQGPFYYDLLHASLDAHYAKSVAYQNRAESGSQTGALLGQIEGLPAQLPGPVVVTITSGGNDMKDNLVPILLGFDGAARVQMGDNIDAALSALALPERFGAGVEVHVFYATIYDASDGAGDYQTGGCVMDMNSPSSTDPFFESWNGEIRTRVEAQQQVVADMHGHFYGHGYNNPPTWYASDCTHPNPTGHDELHALFLGLITDG